MTTHQPANPLRRGLFVTIDGPGAAGKSTITHALTARLTDAGIPVHATREPSPGPIGEMARHGTHHFHGATLACLVAADRYHHLATTIRPALAAGHVVVCDRYIASSLVLQRRDGLPLEFIEAINQYADRPDLAIILTGNPTLISARLAHRGSHGRFEDTDATTTELTLYTEAAHRLAQAGITTHTIDSTNETAGRVADQIAALIVPRWTTVTRSNPPGQPR